MSLNIAICIWGQWRSGDICAPYIKNFFTAYDENINVDFFTSVKDYNLYENSSTPSNFNIDGNELLNKLESCYNPKKKKITKDIVHENNYYGVKYIGMADAIMLKKQYELENNIKYDLVFLARYDMLIWPTDYFRNLVRQIQKHHNLMKSNSIFSQSIILESNMRFRHHKKIIWCDSFILGTNNALDILVIELMNFLNYNNQEHVNRFHDIDTHTGIMLACNSGNLYMNELPYYNIENEEEIYIQSPYNKCLPSLNNSVELRKLYSPMRTFLREDFEWTNIDDIFSKHTFDRIHDHYTQEMNSVQSKRQNNNK